MRTTTLELRRAHGRSWIGSRLREEIFMTLTGVWAQDTSTCLVQLKNFKEEGIDP